MQIKPECPAKSPETAPESRGARELLANETLGEEALNKLRPAECMPGRHTRRFATFSSGAEETPSRSRKEGLMNREMNQLPDVRQKY